MQQRLPLLLLLIGHPLLAQVQRGIVIPVGARVKVDQASGPTVEGTVVAWRGDTLLVQPRDRADTLRIAPTALKKLRVVESPALWRYSSPSDINFSVVADLPRAHDPTSASGDSYDRLLLVGNKTELAGVNTATGAALWSRKDLADLKGVGMDVVGNTGFGIVTRNDTLQAIDLRTGQKRWDSATLSFVAARGWLPSPHPDTAILMLGSTAASATTLMAVDLPTGRVRWRQDSAFAAEPKVFKSSGVSYLLGNQSPFDDSDTTLVLYLSTDGPIRLDARTGRVLWRATALRGAKLPLPSDGYAYMRQQHGLLFLPSGDSLVAVQVSDGAIAWRAAPLKKPVWRILPTRRGLLVRGGDWFDLLDPASGRSLWRAPVELKNSTRDVMRGDTVYVGGDKRAVAIALGDGALRTIATVEFKEREQPSGFGVWTEGLVLNSWHNLLLVDRQGTVRYQREYPSPKASFGELVNPTVTDIRRPTTRWAGSHIFFFTAREDERGREGFSVVKVDPSDGHEAGRLWFDGRTPWYALDEPTSTALYHRDDHTIDALPFLDGADLGYAVRNDESGVVERLLAMGDDPVGPVERGWTPLHVAAYTGHADVARLLIARGADINRVTPEGWAPWMLAWRERHDSLAQALRGGADSTSAAAGAANGWRLAQQGRIGEALVELKRAVARDSTLGLWRWVWRSVCWQGSLAGQANAVLEACDRAVAVTPAADDNLDYAHQSRAIARALTGNLQGAIADLEDTGASSDDEALTGRWISVLQQGRNPFTPAVLERMRQ